MPHWMMMQIRPSPRRALTRIQVRALAIRCLTLAMVCAGAVVCAGGCGYQQSGGSGDTLASGASASTMPGDLPQGAGEASGGGYHWSSRYREDVKTVAVPIFNNRSFYRGIEFLLTKAVVGQLEGQSPYKVVAKERADTELVGEIENIHVRTISHDPKNVLPQEQLFIMKVAFTWKDLRTGKTLVERRNFEQTAPYYPTLGEGQFTAQQQSVERLALAIVQELQGEW